MSRGAICFPKPELGSSKRLQFSIFRRSNGTTIVSTAADGTPVSQALPVSGLVQKAIEFFVTASEISTNNVKVQGSITTNGNKALEWFDLGTISTPGIFVVTTFGLSGTELEPSLSYVRLAATAGELSPAAFPPSLIATLSGVWLGEGEWVASPTSYHY